jgi:DNA-binding NtrC family response regulator
MASPSITNDTASAARGAARAVILVVDDDAAQRESLKEDLEREGFAVNLADGGRAGLERVKRGGIDLVVSDIKMPDLDGLDLLSEVRAVDPSLCVIIITGFGSIDTAIRAVKLGAYDYLPKPFETDHLLLLIDRALGERALRSENVRLREEVSRHERLDNMIGRSPAMQEVFDLVRRMAGSQASVLVTGDSGTGKELVARAIHAHGPRKARPFVAMNCSAIPETLLESELFGYARGAHSTANTDRQGLFVEADGGTLFLDEIAEMPLGLQPKLLRVLQDGEVRPLGTNKVERVDVRVIAATNRDLTAHLREGHLREDLYYRLNVVQIHLPPLRARSEDVLPLAEHFLARSAARAGKPLRGFSESAKKIMLGYGFPGNVRELENMVERAVALAEGALVGPDDLPPVMRERKSQDRLATAVAQGLTLDQLERQYIERVLESEGGNKTRAALRLGLDRKTLYRKLEEYAATPKLDGDGDAPKNTG